LNDNHIPSLRDGGMWCDFIFYQHFVPDGTAGCGVISFSTNILSLTGQRMRYDSESQLNFVVHLSSYITSLTELWLMGNPLLFYIPQERYAYYVGSDIVRHPCSNFWNRSRYRFIAARYRERNQIG